MGEKEPKLADLTDAVFSIHNEETFARIALEVYNYQFQNNPLYSAFCTALGRGPGYVKSLLDIPFLPIQFFKTKPVVTGRFEPELVFNSSGTTGAVTSQHLVKDGALYRRSFRQGFEHFYGKPTKYCILGLLPSYLEAGHSSLVYMVDDLIEQSKHPSSGFFRNNYEELNTTLSRLERSGENTLLFGVTYALLDFAERYPQPLRHTTIIETGGMKGRRREVTKPELYATLKGAFGLSEIHSEYGMTELLSQAYAREGLYQCPPWMQVLLRDETDPLSAATRTGAVNVIDLANIHSCSFLATDDRGRLQPDGRFEILGRLDHSDVRGCSQLI